MRERLFLYIDVLGFRGLVQSGFDVLEIYRRIDSLNIHRDRDFTCIVFSDTIIAYPHDGWDKWPVSNPLMWLIEFAQDLTHRLISLDINIRAYITSGPFEHKKLNNIDAYYGDALIECYEREKSIKCVGVFLDDRLARHSDIFHLTRYDENSHFVHVLQQLDQVSVACEHYPLSGEILESTGMEWWTAYAFRYLENTYRHSQDESLTAEVRLKYANTWRMIASRHSGLCRRLVDVDFEFSRVVTLDWSEKFARIGTSEGAFE